MLDLNAPLIFHAERAFGPSQNDPKEFESKLMPGHLSLYGIARAIAFSATAHAAILKISRGFDPNRNCGWVVLGLRLRTLKPIPLNFPISCTTWVAATDGARLIREYELHTGSESLAFATQDFVLFDRESRRAMLPPKAAREFLRGLGRKHSYSIDVSRQTENFFSASESCDLKTSSPFLIDESAIDDNNHLNNSVYLRWLEEALKIQPQAGLELALEYINEATLGQSMQVLSAKTHKDPQKTSLRFSLQNTEKTFVLGKCHLLF